MCPSNLMQVSDWNFDKTYLQFSGTQQPVVCKLLLLFPEFNLSCEWLAEISRSALIDITCV